MKKLTICLLLVLTALAVPLLPACSRDDGAFTVPFYRQVAREVCDDGWVYTFVRNGLKDPQKQDDGIIQYQFYGIQMRHQYDPAFVQVVTNMTPKGDSTTYLVIPPILIWGDGSDAQARDMKLVESIIDSKYTPQELLALDPGDYSFEELDGEMFFRLLREALTGEPQKEGANEEYWNLPIFALLAEPVYIDGYKFQVSFLQETGCVDEIFIDVRYQTGEEFDAYTQLSDLVAEGMATREQKEAYDKLCAIAKDIRENESFIIHADSYQNEETAELKLSRLYEMLKSIHENQMERYTQKQLTQKIQPTEGSDIP